MSHGIEIVAAKAAMDPDMPRMLRPLARLLQWVNQALVVLGMVALLVAACVLTYSVVSRYVMHASTDWQDEAAVFCLVGATFLCGAFVQSMRGHVGIEAISGLLPRSVNQVRLVFVDLLGRRFAASLPGSRGRCFMKPGWSSKPPRLPGLHPCGFPMA
jgi:TRAP-type mannitol/chloroaromatic compound transport system permease small subunit